MSNYDRLTGLISSGDIELIHVEAVPRSISTALARSLSESDTPSIYVNEPFNRMKHDIEDASMRILDAVEHSQKDSPITVVSKNMARNISRSIFSEMMELSKGIVWSIRDPHVQISSLITRIANDLQYEPGADVLTMEELTDDNIRQASEFLENGPKSTNFSKTSWYDMGQHHMQLEASTISVVVDGLELTEQPAKILRSASHLLNLVFSDQMVNGWQGEFINANTGYNPNLTDGTHAWTKEAVISTGIKPSSQKTIDIGRIPESLQEHLMGIALPTYERMMAKVD